MQAKRMSLRQCTFPGRWAQSINNPRNCGRSAHSDKIKARTSQLSLGGAWETELTLSVPNYCLLAWIPPGYPLFALAWPVSINPSFTPLFPSLFPILRHTASNLESSIQYLEPTFLSPIHSTCPACFFSVHPLLRDIQPMSATERLGPIQF